MRDTRRSLIISGSLAGGGSALTILGAWLTEVQGQTLMAGIPLFLGLFVAPLSIFWFLSSIVAGRRKEKLEAGSGEIARWTVSAAEWAAFRAQESRLVAAGQPPNLLNLRNGPPVDGEVIFARRAVIADEDYQDLTPGGLIDLQGVEWVSGNPSHLEFHMISRRTGGSSGTNYGTDHHWLRIPVGANEGREATKAFAHYKKTTKRGVAIAMRNPKLTYTICFVLVAICAISALWGFSNRVGNVYGDAPLYAAIIGVLGGLGALILAAIVFLRVRVLKS
jgi:hypothetical protein